MPWKLMLCWPSGQDPAPEAWLESTLPSPGDEISQFELSLEHANAWLKRIGWVDRPVPVSPAELLTPAQQASVDLVVRRWPQMRRQATDALPREVRASVEWSGPRFGLMEQCGLVQVAITGHVGLNTHGHYEEHGVGARFLGDELICVGEADVARFNTVRQSLARVPLPPPPDHKTVAQNLIRALRDAARRGISHTISARTYLHATKAERPNDIGNTVVFAPTREAALALYPDGSALVPLTENSQFFVGYAPQGVRSRQEQALRAARRRAAADARREAAYRQAEKRRAAHEAELRQRRLSRRAPQPTRPPQRQEPATALEIWQAQGWIDLEPGTDPYFVNEALEGLFERDLPTPVLLDTILGVPGVDDLFCTEDDAARFLAQW